MNIIKLFFSFFMISTLFSAIPDVKLTNISDNIKYSLQDYYKEDLIAVNFWNLACEPCKKEMKYLDEYNQKYEPYNFQIVSVNIDQGRNLSKVKSYVSAKEYSFPVLSDPRMLLFRKLGGKIMPYLIIIDQEGNIVKSHIGYNPGDEVDLEKTIQKIVNYLPNDSLKTNQVELEK